MRTVIAAVLGLVTGVVVADAPSANGAVMLLGVMVGAVLFAAIQDIVADYRQARSREVRR